MYSYLLQPLKSELKIFILLVGVTDSINQLNRLHNNYHHPGVTMNDHLSYHQHFNNIFYPLLLLYMTQSSHNMNCAHALIHIHMCVYTCTQTHTCTHRHACMRARTHIHVHARTCTQTHQLIKSLLYVHTHKGVNSSADLDINKAITYVHCTWLAHDFNSSFYMTQS